MACGKAVAAADGGPSEFVEDGVNGFLVEPTNSTAYAEAVIQLLEDPSLSKRLEESAAKKARSDQDESEATAKMARRLHSVALTLESSKMKWPS